MGRLIDADRFRDVLERYINAPHVNVRNKYTEGMRLAIKTCIDLFDAQRTIDAIELPKGRPGDYLKWTNGVSERIFHINSIVICEDGMRYDLGDLCPFVNHPNILRIMSREEAEKEVEHGKAD